MKNTVKIKNVGGNQKLRWKAQAWPHEWLSLSKTKGSIKPNSSEKITIKFYPKKYYKSKRKKGAVRVYRGKGKKNMFTIGVY